jgi:hypothetical protein
MNMRSTKIVKIAAFAVVYIFFQTSCSKEFLDQKPNNSITDENFYKTEDDAIRATNAVYNPLQGLYNGAAWQILDIMSDDADKGGSGAGDESDLNDLDNFSMDATQPKLNTYYTQCYLGVQRANLVLGKVPGITGMSETTRKRCLGEAYFLRAYYYYMLVRLFGDVPFYTKPITLEESYNIKRTSKSIVYNGIVSDLISAAGFLPADRFSGDNAGRVNSWAAKGMLASVYLTINEKEKAAEQALAVINSGKYTLNQEYGDNFDVKKENGPESLFEVQYRNVGGSFKFFSQGNVVNTWFAPRNLDLVVDKPGYGFNVPTEDLVSEYERDKDKKIIDKRRPASIWMPGDVFDGQTFPPSQDGSPRGYNVRKYFVSKNIEFADANGWSCAGNIPVMRYSEVLLIAAEALGAGAGDKYINEVRKRAGLSDIQSGSTDFLEAVYKERRIEFSSEMHRWFDLIRHPDPNYMLNKMRAVGKNPSQKHYLMPLPQIERDKNPNLTQNDGY